MLEKIIKAVTVSKAPMKKTKGAIAVVMSTAPDAKTAMTLAKSLVQKRLAACCNIVPQATSVYWWKGKIEVAEENLLILKTTQSRLKALVKELKEIHPYEVPEILVSLPSQGSKSYLKWIADSTKKPVAKKKNVVSKL